MKRLIFTTVSLAVLIQACAPIPSHKNISSESGYVKDDANASSGTTATTSADGKVTNNAASTDPGATPTTPGSTSGAADGTKAGDKPAGDAAATPRVADFSLFKISDDDKKKMTEESANAKRNGNLPEIVKDDNLKISLTSKTYDVSKWTEKTMVFPSKDSKIYAGTDAPPALKKNETFNRNVVLYLPPNFVEGEELPFMVVGDGNWSQHKKLMVPTLTNLILQKRLPRMAAVFIDAGPGDSDGSQRGLEYDMVTERYTLFVEGEILPALEKSFKVKFTKDPKGRGAMGGSSSSTMAFTMAWFHPELYTRVASYSGSFTQRRVSENFAKGAWDYHEKVIPATARKPLRVALEVGEMDLNFGVTNNWIVANQNMAKVLSDKGYPYRFFMAKNAGHIDSQVYEATLAETLEWLWLDYPIH